jgi:hypothetical protein
MYSVLPLVIWIGIVFSSGDVLQANEPNELANLEDLSVDISESTWSNVFAENTKQLLIVEFYSPLCGML